MKWIFLWMLALSASAPLAKPRVLIQTSMGDIVVELESEKAPVTTKNFLRYVEAGRYNGGKIHRTVTMDNQPDKKVKIEVIQGGTSAEMEKKAFSAIKLERTKDTATSDFFICIGDQPELDFGGKRNPDGQGFAAFGRVIKGMDIVRKIQVQPAKDQTLTPPIGITNIRKSMRMGK